MLDRIEERKGDGGRKPILTAIPLVRQLFEEIDRRRIPYREIERLTGVHQVTLTTWKRGANAPRWGDFSNVASVLGYDIVLQPKETDQ
jgi:hypothetical protein